MKTVAPLDASEEARLLTEVSTLAQRAARRLVGDDAAEDIAQDVVLDCLTRIRTGRWEAPDSLAAFVSAAVWRNHADALRRTKHRRIRDAGHLREREDCASAWMNPELAMEERELEAARVRALQTLPRACRASYAMVREQHASYEVTAERLGITRATVCSHVARAQRHLRRELRAEGVRTGGARKT